MKTKKYDVFNLRVEEELFSTPKTKYQEEVLEKTKNLMIKLGGNWKRLSSGKHSIYVSDLGKIIGISGREINYSVQNNGYISYCTTTVHRIVCYAFGKIKNLKYDKAHPYEIDHIDNDKTNNALSNLKVITHKENIEKRDINGNKRSIKVDCYKFEDGSFVKTFKSYKEAADELNLDSPTIYYTTIKKIRQTHGYTFRKAGEPFDPDKESRKAYVSKKSIIRFGVGKRKYNIHIPMSEKNIYTGHDPFGMFDSEGNLVKVYKYYSECAKDIKSDKHTVRARLIKHSDKPLHGYTFKYVTEDE